MQVRHYRCWDVACICAVAVQEGNTVLGVDACDHYTNPGSHFAPDIKQYSAKRELGAAVYKSPCGKHFAVCKYTF